MLARVYALDADIAELETIVEEMVAPFAGTIARLDEIPGVGPVAAAVIVSEIGLDMSRFPTDGHLASWAKFTPQTKESAGKTKGKGSTGHGNRYLAKVLGRPRSALDVLTPSSANATGASRAVAANRRPSSPSDAPSSSPSGPSSA